MSSGLQELASWLDVKQAVIPGHGGWYLWVSPADTLGLGPGGNRAFEYDYSFVEICYSIPAGKFVLTANLFCAGLGRKNAAI